MALSHTLYDTMPGSPVSMLSADYIAGTSTDITLEDGSIAPDAPNIITVMTEDKSQFATVQYDAKNGNTLSVLTVIRGDGITFEAGHAIAVRNYTYEDDSGIKVNITDIEQRVETLEGSSLNGVAGVKINGTELQKDAENKVDIPIGGSSLGVVKSGNEAVISSDGSIDISTATNRLESAINEVSGDLSEHLADFENPHNVTKEDVGLGNADNTSDLSKPISTATQAALDLKADSADVTTALNGKVDKVTGKQLSTEDYSTAEKQKLAGIEDSAEVNVLEGVQVGGIDQTITSKKVNIPVASASVLGVVKVGDNLTIDSAGKLSATAQPQEQADWDESDTTASSYIKGKPTAVSDFTNDLDFQTETEVSAAIGTHNSSTTAHSDIRTDISELESGLDGKVDKVTGKGLSSEDYTSAEKTKLAGIEEGAEANVNADWTASSGDAAILNKPTKVSDFTNDSGFQTASNVSSAIGEHNTSNSAHSDLRSAVEGKVDKETGKGLSTNDFTTAYKNKVDNTASGLESHVADTNNPHEVTASQIGVEDGAQVNVIEGIKINGSDVALTDKKANIPPASASALGVIKVGTNLSIAADGTLSATGGELSQLPADWAQTDSTQPDFIKNKPTLGTAAAKNTGTGTDNVILGNDSRLTDAREPTEHASTHAVGGSDELTPDAIGLGNVDNTADLFKPISYAVETALSGKVDVVSGKSLSTNDYTTADKTKLGQIEANAQVNIIEEIKIDGVAQTPTSKSVNIVLAGKASASDLSNHINDTDNPHQVSKSDVGLGNCDNTSDLNKPISTAVSTALSGKVDVVSGKGLSSNDYSTAEKTKLAAIEDGAQENVIESVKVDGTALDIVGKAVNIDLATPLENKVDKDGSKVLSTNDFTTPLKTKLEGIPSNAEENTIESVKVDGVPLIPDSDKAVDIDLSGKVDVESGKGLSSNDFTTALKDKLTAIPATAEENVLESVKVNNVAQTITNKSVNISVPTTVSELSDSDDYALKTDVSTAVSTHNSDSSAHTAIRQSVADEVSRAEGVESTLQNQIDALTSKTDVVDVVGTKAALLAYDTSKLLNNDIVKVLVDESQSNAISYYRWVITAGTGAWNYVGSQGPFYTKSEADNYFVPQQRTVNGQSLDSNIVLDAEDVGALPDTTVIPSALSALTDDSTHRLVTDAQITSWNGKQSALTFDNTPTENSNNPVKSGGVYSALSGKVNVETGKGLSSNDYTSAEKTKLSGIESGAQVNVQADWTATTAATGSIKNKPTIPSKTSDLTNDSGFITGVSWTDVTSKPTTFAPSAHNHAASEITSGTLSADRIPSLTKSKISDFPTSMTPTAHASTHSSSGTDPITPASIGAANASHTHTVSQITDLTMPKSASGTLTSGGWSSKSQTISISGMTSTCTVLVTPAPSSIEEYVDKGVVCTAQGSGTLTFTCSETPTNALTVNVVMIFT